MVQLRSRVARAPPGPAAAAAKDARVDAHAHAHAHAHADHTCCSHMTAREEEEMRHWVAGPHETTYQVPAAAKRAIKNKEVSVFIMFVCDVRIGSDAALFPRRPPFVCFLCCL